MGLAVGDALGCTLEFKKPGTFEQINTIVGGGGDYGTEVAWELNDGNGNTIIGDGCKIDNLVQIGHNSVLGKSCIMAGSSGLAGTVTLGDGVVIGGGAKNKV